MASVATKVSRLLEATGGSGGWDGPPCEECGWRSPDDDSPTDTYELTFPGDYSDDDLGNDPQEEFCSSCGKQLSWVLSFPDEPPTKTKLA